MLSARSFRFLICRLWLAPGKGGIVFNEAGIGLGFAISVCVPGASFLVCEQGEEATAAMAGCLDRAGKDWCH